jgi:hypothetical protein
MLCRAAKRTLASEALDGDHMRSRQRQQVQHNTLQIPAVRVVLLCTVYCCLFRYAQFSHSILHACQASSALAIHAGQTVSFRVVSPTSRGCLVLYPGETHTPFTLYVACQCPSRTSACSIDCRLQRVHPALVGCYRLSFSPLLVPHTRSQLVCLLAPGCALRCHNVGK